MPTGFVATSPASGSATVAITSASATGIDFGARQTNLQITASAIDDVNANAAADVGEAASAATITLYRDTNGDGSLTLGTDEVVLADQVGTLSKTGLSPDTYFLVETDVTDYVDTGSVVASSGPSTKVGLDQFTIVLTDTSSLGNTFLDALGTASITGFVYSDLNGSGGWNAGEPVKSGVTLSLAKGGTTTTSLSGADGVFTFGSLTTGTYTLTAALTGWTVKGTTSYTVVLAAGEAATGKDFYLQQSNLVISGTVYQDNNADGINQTNTTLAGATVRAYADANADGVEHRVADGGGHRRGGRFAPADRAVGGFHHDRVAIRTGVQAQDDVVACSNVRARDATALRLVVRAGRFGVPTHDDLAVGHLGKLGVYLGGGCVEHLDAVGRASQHARQEALTLRSIRGRAHCHRPSRCYIGEK